MKDYNKIKRQIKTRRKGRVRSKIAGTAEQPRLSVFKSLSHINVQLIDDSKGVTLVSATDQELKVGKKTKAELSFEVGKLIAKKALEKKIEQVVFDRGSSKYHGRVKAVADGAREGGLKF
jgi:large subunit ribosomal protein L18